MKKTFKNPILPGFYPDPSVCKKEDSFYLVTSTFAYFPGIPIFRSKDLVNWEQIGNVLSREEQLPLEGSTISRGIFAPTIRIHNNIFYVVCTNVSHGGNFIVTSKNPEGPWSNPHYIEGADGIDPSLFFDDDGKCYYHGTREKENGKYYGDNDIYLQQLDLNTMKLVGKRYIIWNTALKDAVWPEAPHIYKKDGYYYLLISEGGTSRDHAITVARSKNLTDYYIGHKKNPILTHRHLGNDYPIVNVGHGDLIETNNNEWWMVLLASRPIDGKSPLGRETFLVPVSWEEGWPVVNYGIGKVLEEERFPNLTEYKFPEKSYENYEYIYYNNLENIYYKGVRQEHFNFETRVVINVTENKSGLCIFQNEKIFYVLLVKKGNIEILFGKKVLLKSEFKENKADLKIICENQKLDFYVNDNLILENSPMDELCTEVSGGFVGNTIGMYSLSKDFFNFENFKYIGK